MRDYELPFEALAEDSGDATWSGGCSLGKLLGRRWQNPVAWQER
jgi:hypothetical protein